MDIESCISRPIEAFLEKHGGLLNQMKDTPSSSRVCNKVWGVDDRAYRCKTCQLHATSAVCQDCFLKGNHQGHDYSLINTLGGCCDCGDTTGWKPDGFCSTHSAQHLDTLPLDLSVSLLPQTFSCLKELVAPVDRTKTDLDSINTASELIIDLLLELCNCGGSMLTALTTLLVSNDYLAVMFRVECMLDKSVVKKLHHLFFNCLGDGEFKFKFAEEIAASYTHITDEAILNSVDVLSKYPSLSVFSVQIFTVPVITTYLTKEKRFLEDLFDCVVRLSTQLRLYHTLAHLLGAVRYVMTNAEVLNYITQEKPAISRFWIKDVVSTFEFSFALPRVSDEDGHFAIKSKLECLIADINSLLVAGAFTSGPTSPPSSVLLLADVLLEEIAKWTSHVQLTRLSALGESEWHGVRYEVGSAPMLLHMPLHHSLGLMLQTFLNKSYGESRGYMTESSCSSPSVSLCFDFFSQILRDCHPHGCSSIFMESPLRKRVFCAQVHAGMWKETANSTTLCELYYSSQRRDQGVELDLFLLQCCAALAPADLYVQKILDQFGLSYYLSLSPEQSNKYETDLVREMLVLIIQVVKERRHCGYSDCETLRRDLIFKLATGDATYSELVKSLPRSLSSNDHLNEILDTIATYAIESDKKQRSYSLKGYCWNEFDLYHPLRNLIDLQKIEEKYQSFCKVSCAVAQQPRWVDPFYPLTDISKVATCRKVLEIVRAVLIYADRTSDQSSPRVPDALLVTALHLFSLSICICNELRNSGQYPDHDNISYLMAFVTEEFDSGSQNLQPHASLLALLVSLLTRQIRSSDFLMVGESDVYLIIKDILLKLVKLNADCLTKLNSLSSEVVSLLWPPLDKSGSHSLDSTLSHQDNKAKAKEHHKAKAKERQAAMLEEMKAAQMKFLETFDSTLNEGVDASSPLEESNEGVSEEGLECSSCKSSGSSSPLSFMIFLQKSRLASLVDEDLSLGLDCKYACIKEETDHNRRNVDGFGASDSDGIHMSSCGHTIHQDCYDEYLSTQSSRSSRSGVGYAAGQVLNLAQGEITCPVCRRRANALLPIPSAEYRQVQKQILPLALGSEVARGSSIISPTSMLHLSKAIYLLKSASTNAEKSSVLRESGLLQTEMIPKSIEPVFLSLCRLYFSGGNDNFPKSGGSNHSLIFWDTLRYTIISTEIAARSRQSTRSNSDGVESLYRELESSKHILSLLLQVIERSHSCHDDLRSRGLQLLNDSIGSGTSVDRSSCSEQGGFFYMQFWERASDPILSSDPFSSLMWILFCLPFEFLFSKESCLALVHLLYSVCVIQVLCCGDIKLDSGDNLVGDIYKLKEKNVSLQEYFVSHYIDTTRDMKEMIRTLTCPYLRRCALLWKLLKFSNSSMNTSSDMLDDEIYEIHQLENMFCIPNMDIVLKDQQLRDLSLNWLGHFSKKSKGGNDRRILHLTDAHPLRLIHLPELYRDLLHRYVDAKCPKCHAKFDEPALCLCCGRLFSPSWKRCCRGGGCEAHAKSCSAGIGLFLLIKKNNIFLQMYPGYKYSLYLDTHGEEVPGADASLSKERYSVIAHLVATHGLPHVSEGVDPGAMEMFLLLRGFS